MGSEQSIMKLSPIKSQKSALQTTNKKRKFSQDVTNCDSLFVLQILFLISIGLRHFQPKKVIYFWIKCLIKKQQRTKHLLSTLIQRQVTPLS